jgi:hypothetical protein
VVYLLDTFLLQLLDGFLQLLHLAPVLLLVLLVHLPRFLQLLLDFLHLVNLIALDLHCFFQLVDIVQLLLEHHVVFGLFPFGSIHLFLTITQSYLAFF